MTRTFLAPLLAAFIPISFSAPTQSGVFNFVVENDAIFDTDYHYTSGILFDYVSGPEETSDAVQSFAYGLPAVGGNDQIYTGLHLGQQIFTPDDIHTDQLIPEERPYAGYLFGGVSLLAVNPRELLHWTLNIGVVGPAARAQEFQSSIHERLGANLAQGWDNQLDNETIVQFDYQKSWRQLWTYFSGRFGADLVPHAGFALGNAIVHVNAGFTLRAGQGLSSDFGPPRMQPGLPGSNFFNTTSGSGWYVFLGVGGRYVAHNIFLDGNNNAISHSVDKNNWVGEIQTGLVLNSRDYRLAYTFVTRTREYASQELSDSFGSLTLSVKF